MKMITGYEEITGKLTKEEMKIVKITTEAFFYMLKGRKHQLTIRDIISRLKGAGFEISEPRMRKIIQFIRINNLVSGICSDSGGYWIAENSDEFKQTLISLKDRITNQIGTYNELRQQYKKMVENEHSGVTKQRSLI